MAQGDIPVEGSAPDTFPGDPKNTFRITALTRPKKDDRDHLLVNTGGKELHIFVDNGDPDPEKRKTFDEDLFSPGWQLRITQR
jgi:hypothetical protein